MEAALRARALAHAPLTGLVGDRVGWEARPQLEGLPAVTLQTVGGRIAQNYKGNQALQATRVQADVWASSYGEKKAVAAALLAALVPPGEQDGVRFGRGFVERDEDLTAGDSAAARAVRRRSIDLIIWWKAT